MWPVVHSADRHAELGAVPVTPSVHPRSLQSPQDFYTARSHLLTHEIVPVACSASSSTSSWSPSSCDSLMAGDQHKVVSDRSASGQSEHSCSVKEPSLVDMRHEVPSVSLERPHVVFTPKARQVTALTGPVKSTSTAQEFSKVYNYCAIPSAFHLYLAKTTWHAPVCWHCLCPWSLLFVLASGCLCCFTVCFAALQAYMHIAWAAQYNAWLLIKSTPKGVVFSFCILV